MAYDIGPKIGIEGENQYRNAMRTIVSQTQALNNEMKKVTTSFTSADTKEQKLAATNKVLSKQIQATATKIDLLNSKYEKEKAKLEELDKALQKAKEENGENSAEAKKAQSAYNDQATACNKLASQINKAEAELNQMQTALEDNTDKLKLMGEKLQDTGAKLESIGGGMQDVGTALTASITTPLVGAASAAVKVGSDFDAAMSQVSAVSGATGDDFDKLRDKAQEMGAKTKFSATESAEAMNYMAMAGWKTGDMLDGIEGIMNLAAASGEDLATTSDIVTDALTAFGLSAADSGHFADVLAAASSNANTNVSMLGESFKYVAPVAGAMGYSAEDTSIALGLMANAGIKASQAGTALRTTLTNMANPTDSMAAAMKELGVSLDDGQGHMYSLREIMVQLRDGFGELKISQEEYDTTLAKISQDFEDGTISEKKYQSECERLAEKAFGAEGALKAQAASSLAGKNAMAGLLAIVSASDKDFEKLTTAIDTCDGTSQDMADTMQNNLSGQLTILGSTIEGIGIQISDILTPGLSKVVGVVQDVATKFSDMDESSKKAILTIAGIAAAIGPVIAIAGTVVSAVGGIATAIGGVATAVSAGSGVVAAVGTALGALAGPIAIAVALVAGLAVAVATHWDQIKAVVTGAVAAVGTAVTTGFTTVKEFAVGIWDGISTAISTVWSGIVTTISSAWETITSVIQVAVLFVGEIIASAVQIITLPWQFLWENCKGYVLSAWEAIKTAISTALEAISTTISNALGTIVAVVSPALETIKGGVTMAFDGIKTVTTSAWTAVKNTVTTAVNGVKSVVTTVFSGVKSVATSIWTGIKTNISNVVNGIKTNITNSFNAVKTRVTSVFNSIKTAITGPMNAAKNTLNNILNSIKNKFSSIFSNVKNTVSNAISFIRGKFNFSWSLPKLKLPHFSVSGKFGLNPPSVPHFSIKWYRKAYDNAMLLSNPTIFGYGDGSFLGGGDGNGAEVVAGASTLMGMMQSAVNSAMAAQLERIVELLEVMAPYMPEIAAQKQVVMDTGAWVGATAPSMDKALARLAAQGRRGR